MPIWKRWRLLIVGVALFALGTGPLLVVSIAAALGLTSDPNPNPVGLGLLAVVTFVPSVLMILIGIGMGAARGRRSTSLECPQCRHRTVAGPSACPTCGWSLR